MNVRSLFTGLIAAGVTPFAFASAASAQVTPAQPAPAQPATVSPATVSPATVSPATVPPPAAQPAPGAPPIMAPGATSSEAAPRAVTASVAADTAASEAAAPRQGLAGRFEGGLRTGISFGLGKAGRNDFAPETRNVNDIAEYRVPIWIDLGYRVSEPLTLGVYAQLGLGGGGDCDGSCNSSDLRIGAQALWHAPSGGLWLGAGLGYEWLSLYALQLTGTPIDQAGDNAAQFASRLAETIGGPELTLQAGLDVELEPGVSVGPYVAASVGQYLTDSFDCDGVDCPGGSSIDGSATHAWLGLGVRGSYAP